MSRLVIFKAPPAELRRAEIYPLFPGGGSSDIITQWLDYSNGEPPQAGDRPNEFRDNGHLEPSSVRLSPWRVNRVDTYAADTGFEEFDEVVVAYCEYAPLPEAENPWRKSQVGQITVDSCGGDAAAYEAWKAQQQVTV